jgi:phosphatidylserine/phosphatidylglycerophosphate/cardiolipin synthase-like enzyme
MILQARAKVRMAVPFFDGGASDVVEQLQFAAARNVRLQLLCRDISRIPSAGALAGFATRMLSEGALRQTRDFASLRWEFHAKVLICDDQVAYVGSANLTQASLVTQAEVGVVVTDPDLLEKLNYWFSDVWSTFGT